MYKIEKKDYGYLLTFVGFIRRKEMESWYKDSITTLENSPANFGVLADLRGLKTPLPMESQSTLEEGQKYYKKKGMVRSIVILNDNLTKIQYKRIAMNTGIRQYERYIDASLHENWEQIAISWLKDATEPEEQS